LRGEGKPDGPRGGHALQPGEHDKYAISFSCGHPTPRK
jgi:hypothetical protein